jgi:hypothetical protein
MCLEALLEVGGDAYITLGGDGKALEKIDILHDRPPSLKLRRTPFALQRRRQLVTEKVACHLERRVVEAALQCKEPLLQVTFTLT